MSKKKAKKPSAAEVQVALFGKLKSDCEMIERAVESLARRIASESEQLSDTKRRLDDLEAKSVRRWLCRLFGRSR